MRSSDVLKKNLIKAIAKPRIFKSKYFAVLN